MTPGALSKCKTTFPYGRVIVGLAQHKTTESEEGDASERDLADDRAGGEKVSNRNKAIMSDPGPSSAQVKPVAKPEVKAEDEDLRVFLNRLADLLVLPSGNLPPQERALIDELAAGTVSLLSLEYRAKLSERLIKHSSSPPILIRHLLHSEEEVALPIIRSFLGLQEVDLISVVQKKGEVHQSAVATRHFLPSSVCDALVTVAPGSVLRKMLRNDTAKLSRPAFVLLTQRCMQDTDLIDPLISRRNFPPDLAHLAFWWADARNRRRIIERFACDRDAIHDIMPQSTLEGLEQLGGDAAQAARMIFSSNKLDRKITDAALDALENGDGNRCLDLLAEGMNIKQETVAQILDDSGGEAVAVLAKACSFGRKRLIRVRRILAKMQGKTWDEKAARDDNVTIVHDLLSTDKADVVLRYWDRTSREITD